MINYQVCMICMIYRLFFLGGGGGVGWGGVEGICIGCKCPFKMDTFHLTLEYSFAQFVFLVSCDCCVALPRGAMGLPAVCDCGIS